jgi:hypothetical protein
MSQDESQTPHVFRPIHIFVSVFLICLLPFKLCRNSMDVVQHVNQYTILSYQYSDLLSAALI